MAMLSPILIVGGCGYLGRNIAAELTKSQPGCHIEVLDIRPPETALSPAVSKYHEADITNLVDVTKVLASCRPRTIFHAAAPRTFVHDEDYCKRNIVDGTRNLVESALKCGVVKAFVYTSGSSVIHDSSTNVSNADETAPVLCDPQRVDPCQLAKAMAETMVLEHNRANGSCLLTASLRPSTLFGRWDEDDVTTARILRSAVEGTLNMQLGDNANLVDWTWIENAAHAHVLAALALVSASVADEPLPSSRKVEGEAFFITNDEPMPFWNFARGLGTAAGFPVKPNSILVVPHWLGYPIGFASEWFVWMVSLGTKQSNFSRRVMEFSQQVRTFNISKAKTRLGYDPHARVNMEEGLRRAADGFSAGR